MTARSKFMSLVFAAAAMTSACSSDITGVADNRSVVIREQSERGEGHREGEIKAATNKCAVYRNEFCERP